MGHDHHLLIILTVVVGILIVSHILERFDLLAGPLTSLGLDIPFWPTFVVLLVVATVLAWPDIQDDYDAGHRVYAVAKIEMLQSDGIHDLVASMTSGDQCPVEQAQWKFDEAQAEALEELGDDNQAKQVRASQHLGPECGVPSTPDP